MFSDSVSKLIFKKSDFDSLEDLFTVVGKQMQILTQSNNSMIFYQLQDVSDVYVLEYCPIGLEDINEETKFPTWLDVDELAVIQASRIAIQLENMNKAKESLEREKEELDSVFSDKDSIGKA